MRVADTYNNNYKSLNIYVYVENKYLSKFQKRVVDLMKCEIIVQISETIMYLILVAFAKFVESTWKQKLSQI